MKILGIVFALVVVALVALPVLAAAVPEEFEETPAIRVVWLTHLVGPDFFVRLETEDGQTVINAVVDDLCFLTLFVDLDALNTYRTYYITENVGGGGDGLDQRYVVDGIPRLVVANRVGLPD